MRFTLAGLALLLLIPAISAQVSSQKQVSTSEDQTGFCPQTHALQAEPQAEYWFEGTIGERTARMYLDRGGRGVVASLYFTAGDWTPVLLGGEWDNGAIELTDATEQHPLTLRLQGRLTNEGFAGTWASAANDAALPVRLAAVPQPKCDGRGAWKRFESPRWPASFSYPANWRLHESGDSITFTCPDPRAMAYESDVTVNAGDAKPSGQNGLAQCPVDGDMAPPATANSQMRTPARCRKSAVARASRSSISMTRNGGSIAAAAVMWARQKERTASSCCRTAGSNSAGWANRLRSSIEWL